MGVKGTGTECISLSRFNDPHSLRRQQRRKFFVKHSEFFHQLRISAGSAPAIEVRREADSIQLVASECRGMPMEGKGRQRVQLLLLGKSSIQTERPAAGGELLEKQLAVPEFNPFFHRHGRGDRINWIAHAYLGGRSEKKNAWIMLRQTPHDSQVTKIQA